MRARDPTDLEPDLQTFADSVDQPIWVADASGAILYVNAPARRVLGHRQPTQVLDLLAPPDRPALAAWLNAGGELPDAPLRLHLDSPDDANVAMELRLRRLSRERMLLSATLLGHDGGYPVHGGISIWDEVAEPRGVGNALDSERRVLHERLRHQQDALRQERQFSDDLIDSLPGLMYLLDEAGKMVRWSNGLEITGYPDEAIATMSALDFFAGADRERIRDTIETALSQGAAAIEADLVRADGDRAPYYFTARRTEIGAARYVIGFGQDISDARAAAEALREREESFSLIFNQAGDGIELTDAETLRFVEVNDTSCRLLGYTREELLGMTLVDIQGDRDEAGLHEQAARALAATGKLRFDGKHRRKDGTLLDVHVSLQAVHLRGRRHFIGVWRDITAEKAAQAALVQEAQWRRALLAPDYS